MKKIITLCVAVAAMVCMTSCCNHDNGLKASKAKSIVKKEMVRKHLDQVTTSIKVGYYECNDAAARYELRQLAANELLTYKCDIVMKPERVQKSRRVQRYVWGYSYYDTEYYYVNDTVPTYFVTVDLTDKGKKLVVEEQEIKPTADEKELKLDFEPDLSRYPESAVEFAEFPGDADSEEVAEEGDVDTEGDGVPATAVPVGDNSTAYEKAKAQENIVVVSVKAFKAKVVKVRNIYTTGNNYTNATGEVLLEATDVTPFGRIVEDIYEGQRTLVEGVSFIRFEDKGWTIDKIN